MATTANAAKIRLTRQSRQRSNVLIRIWSVSSLSFKEITGRVTCLCLFLSVFTLTVMCIVNAIRWVDKPFPGFLFNQRMVVATLGQYHWTGIQAGLRFPDKIRKADNEFVSSAKDLDELIGKKLIGAMIEYSVERGDQVIQIAIPTMRFTWVDLLMTYFPLLFIGIACFLLGMTVFIMKPDTTVSWVFLLAGFLLGTEYVVGFDTVATHYGFIRLYLLVLTFLPAAAVNLSLVFPEQTKLVQKHPYVQIIPYLVSALIVIPLEIFYPGPIFLYMNNLAITYRRLSVIALLISTLSAYLRSSSILATQRAKVVLLGTALAFPIPAAVTFMGFLGHTLGGMSIQNNFLAIPIIIFPAAIAYAIAKHDLFDVDVYIKRAVGYGVMTAVVGLTYFSVQLLTRTVIFSPLFGDYGETVYPILFALVVVFLFNPINRRVQDGVDRLFFRKKFDYKETIGSVSNALTSLLNLDEILKQVVYTIRREMFVDTAGVVILGLEKKPCEGLFIGDTTGNGKDEVKEMSITPDEPLLTLLSDEKRLITKYDVEEDPAYRDVKEVCDQSFGKMAASMAIPLMYKGKVTGALAVGDKKSGHFYSREDVDLLVTMANQAAVAIENAKLVEQMRKEETVRTNLARYLSPQIVDEIVKKDVQVNLGGDKKVVTVLFSDIRNFTGITEARPPGELVHILNEYFTEMANIIFAHQGSLDKYIGDAIVAVFGSLIVLENSAQKAVQAAIQMMTRLPDLNERWGREYGFRMDIGIGINTGEVFLGNIGSPERMEFTVIGDTVNVASRFSGLARPGQILVARETLNCLGGEIAYRELPPAEVKGKGEKINVFEIIWP